MAAALTKRWSVRTNHYEWITDYLAARGVTGAVRALMASIAGSLAICLLVLLLSVDAPAPGLPSTMMWTAFFGGIAGVVLWTWRWPTRRQSLAFALVSNASVALACLSYPNPQGALFGCIAFATTAAYFAFFHSTALVFYNFMVATVVAVIVAARVARTEHLALAAVDLFLVTQINIVMPVAIHLLLRALGTDLERAGRDPLTGLLDRRSFQRYTAKMLAEIEADPGAHLVVVMVDLDNFKRLNDTRGHQAGDDALVAVGRALGEAVAGTVAVVARSGGEEFVVAAACAGCDPSPLAARVCRGIAELPMAITASVGTACTPIGNLRRTPSHLRSSVDRLVRAADEAMYTAKRAGGNRHHHSRVA